MSASFDVASFNTEAVLQPDGPLRIYFAHPVTTYDTCVETEVLVAIKKWVGADTFVENPNTLRHQTNYLRRNFDYWLDLARTCNVCVFMPFDDRRVGSGVAAEIQTFFDRFKRESRVYEWVPIENLFRRRDSDYFAAPGRVLTVEETRERIRIIRTNTI